MEIQISDTLLKVSNRVEISSPAKVLAKIMATGEIWIDPDITLPECQLALKFVLEDYARKLTSRALDGGQSPKN